MIGLKKNGENLDQFPNTILQRERSSPFFMSKDSTGKDGIPGEVSFPFKLPASDKNLRLLDFPHLLPQLKTKVHSCVLDDNGILISDGKLVIDTVTTDLNRNNTGSIDSHFLSNSSDFYKRIENKKLKDLTLGGPREFPWNGYNRAAAGFWKHVHDTWLYNNCDNGDYVFFPISNDGYLGGTRGFQNELKFVNGAADTEINPDYNITSLTPSIYVSYILTQIFEEHGYKLFGELMDDYDFKKLTMVSFTGVYWSDIVFTEPVDPDEEPKLVPTPIAQIIIQLKEHMPPTISVATFIVELQKFLPIGFEFNDNKKTCEIYWLTKLTQEGLKDRTSNFNPKHSISFGDGLGISKIYGIRRNIDSSDIINRDLSIGGRVDSANNSYEPDGVSEYIESNISTMPMFRCIPFVYTGDGSPGTRPPLALLPCCTVEGTWHGKDGDVVEWGLRFLFYRGKRNRLNDGQASLPLGTNDVRVDASVYSNSLDHTDGTWSIGFENGAFGMKKLWASWLQVIGNGETISGILRMPLYEYLQLKWSDVLLINNTTYIISRIREQLPYTGSFQFDAVRKY